MSTTHVAAELRRLVQDRADFLCEYCLIADEDTFLGCQVDHIISEKHVGPTTAENLAHACLCCNVAKGSDIASMDWSTTQIVRLFHPRNDPWAAHFRLDGCRIEGITPIGVVTANLLGFNTEDRLEERAALLERGLYPSAAARKRMQLG
jgi:hypothetical protein